MRENPKLLSTCATPGGGAPAVLCRLVAVTIALWAFGTASAHAEEGKYDRARARHPDLFRAYYDAGVMEYCGLQTDESMAGFFRRRDDLLAAEPLSDDEYRTVRIAAGIAVDFEYADRGLSGQRKWCKTEGLDAYNRFVARFHAQPAEATQDAPKAE